MTDERVKRGQALARRRSLSDIKTLVELSSRIGLDRKTLARAEAGEASEATMDALEHFFDSLDRERGISTRDGVGDASQEMVEFDITGPRTDWHVVVRGPAEIADDLRRQVVELLKDIDRDA